MKVLSQYLLACTAACFIALGSGFVSLFDPAIQYERDAYALAFEVEQKTGLPAATQEIDCTETGEAYADCKLARHMIESSNAFLDLFDHLLKALVIVGCISAILGLAFFAFSNQQNESQA